MYYLGPSSRRDLPRQQGRLVRSAFCQERGGGEGALQKRCIEHSPGAVEPNNPPASQVRVSVFKGEESISSDQNTYLLVPARWSRTIRLQQEQEL